MRPMKIRGPASFHMINLFAIKEHEVKRNPQNYAFLPGAGHILVGPIAAGQGRPLFGTFNKSLCDAPSGAENESWHMLLPPNGAKPKAFQWLAAPRQWFRVDASGRARRSGWTPAYLSSWGWRYVSRGTGLHG